MSFRTGMFQVAPVGAVAAGPSIVPARAASSEATRSIHSGHSLTDAYVHFGPWPNSFRSIVASLYGMDDQDAYDQIIKATIAGSSIQHRYEQDATFAAGSRPYANASVYDCLMITESGPPPHVTDTTAMTNTLDYLCRFVANQIENGAGHDVVLWTIWPSLMGVGYPDTPAAPWQGMTFDDGLPEYEASFKFMADYVSWKMRQLYPSLPDGWRCWLIPGNRWMARVKADVAAEIVPGVTAFADLFIDDIHPDPLTTYGLACFAVSALYQVNLSTADSPYILPAHTDANTVEWPAVSQELAEYFWSIGWELASDFEPVGMGGTSGAAAQWEPADGDLMPQWTLADPNTDPIPAEPAIPEDVIGLVTPDAVTGFSFSPALPAAADGARALTVEHFSAAAGGVYMCVRAQRDSGGPIMGALTTNANGWSGERLLAVGNGGLNRWTTMLYRPSVAELYVAAGTVPLDTDPHTLESWYDDGLIYVSLDGQAVYSAVAEGGISALNYLGLNVETGGYNLIAVTAMDRIPTDEERAGIRAAFEAEG